MSTRATYKFKYTDEYTPDTTFYIHHDGYQEGASTYFYNALIHYINGNSKSLITSFVAANVDKVGFTRDHDAHGDTEYRYTVTDDKDLLVEALDNNILSEDVFNVVFSGTIKDFVNEYAWKCTDAKTSEEALGQKGWGYKKWEPLVEYTTKYGARLVSTLSKLKLDLRNKKKELKAYGENFGVDTGNYRYIESEVNNLKGVIKAFK